MPTLRRIAIAIDLTFALSHHHGIYAGISRFAREHAHWETTVQPRMRLPQSQTQRGRPAYDGIIARATTDLAQDAAAAGVPLVNVWSATPVRSLPSVFSDFTVAGAQAGEHLLHCGYRRFAFLGFRSHLASEMALAAFKETVRRAGCPCTALIVSTKSDESDRAWNRYQNRMRRWITRWQPPVGALVMQDTFCRYLADDCMQARLRIPEDVALIGFGNELLICSQPAPSLSSFDFDSERVGYESAALLERLMDGEAPPTTPLFIKPKELVLRHSTDTYVGDDPLVSSAMRFIVKHAHERIRVEDVAEQAGVSVRTLELHFRAALGSTISQEIGQVRIRRAKRLLIDGDALIKQVARECGFRTAKHFHRMFRLVEGESPSEYRARQERSAVE
jgi:LacI family transcriptional regulator